MPEPIEVRAAVVFALGEADAGGESFVNALFHQALGLAQVAVVVFEAAG